MPALSVCAAAASGHIQRKKAVFSLYENMVSDSKIIFFCPSNKQFSTSLRKLTAGQQKSRLAPASLHRGNMG
jgi:hypothetical protein